MMYKWEVLAVTAVDVYKRQVLAAQLCRRSHAVCGGGGADPGNVAGAAL